ncbi:exopolysaccharide biosynthesis polyprenyl glycosylphosphotransferase family protein [Methyloversatilis sp. RAC08]|uniref:TIGR03013 family XrtA/PEP-CTERM system glycosyltransferase n=1 Tax=Methyloversatilis sp. RAC08 TaxID=1842540 RepID=UPI000857953A|nr:TIGR03013 family XrtA/PEP-CTERM system glycosyltransferase [Methyloversatilis sp. RAC08]AOF82865.1 exopolysaccharide biosynthesis polyprenyl glycosylphosphotransferase family protein [Methyloversatilis sp. RAC08]
MRLVAEALVLLIAGFGAAWISAPGSLESLLPALVPAAVFAAVMTVLMSTLGLYQSEQPRNLSELVGRVLFAFLLGLPVAYMVFRLLPQGSMAMPALDISLCLGFGGILLLRAASFVQADGAGMFTRRILVVGTGPEAASVWASVSTSASATHTIVGFVSVGADTSVDVPSAMVMPEGSCVMQLARDHRANEIVVAVRERRGGVLPLRELLDCKLAGVTVNDLSSFFERMRGQVRLDSLRASWLIYGDGFRQGIGRTVVKRLFDVLAASVLLVVTAPVMLLAAIAIALESGFPVIYRQERVGQGGRTFKVLKFRSMRLDAEADGKPRWASNSDDRVTRVGHFIRKTRIDELPQIFNVLHGDMSFVGPRPERPYFVDQLTDQIPFYAARHSVKPGITGWAQVRYAYGASVDDAVQKLQYDLYYVKNHTLFLDSWFCCRRYVSYLPATARAEQVRSFARRAVRRLR